MRTTPTAVVEREADDHLDRRRRRASASGRRGRRRRPCTSKSTPARAARTALDRRVGGEVPVAHRVGEAERGQQAAAAERARRSRRLEPRDQRRAGGRAAACFACHAKIPLIGAPSNPSMRLAPPRPHPRPATRAARPPARPARAARRVAGDVPRRGLAEPPRHGVRPRRCRRPGRSRRTRRSARRASRRAARPSRSSAAASPSLEHASWKASIAVRGLAVEAAGGDQAAHAGVEGEALPLRRGARAEPRRRVGTARARPRRGRRTGAGRSDAEQLGDGRARAAARVGRSSVEQLASRARPPCTTALISVTRRPPSSSSRMPSIVVSRPGW